MTPLSVFVTTYNNERTLRSCLESVRWADEVVVLDSFSTDKSVSIAESLRCRVIQHKFMGYGRQKQMALEHTTHQWVLFLDADEALSSPLITEIKQLLMGPMAFDGYEIPRQEQLFWTMCSPNTAMNHYLRLFSREKTHFSTMPVHAAPVTQGRIGRLRSVFYHYGEPDVHTKVDKVNAYSTGLLADKLAKGKRPNPWIMIIYPPLQFLKLYILKRNVINGWGGFITSVVGAFYVFLKYAKLYEHAQFERLGASALPADAPPHPRLMGNDLGPV